MLPEFQGFVVGASLSDAVGEWLRRLGSDFYGQTVLGDLPSRLAAVQGVRTFAKHCTFAGAQYVGG